MNKIKEYKKIVFESIKHIDEYGDEYWEARELQKVLEYKRWDKFNNVISNAKKACENSNYVVFEHFSHVGKLSKSNNNINSNFGVNTKIVKTGVSMKEVIGYKLSRYACYLIVQNSDPRKEVVALGQMIKII